MKIVKILAATSLIIVSYWIYSFFSSRPGVNPVKLKADGILTFDSVQDLQKKYPFVGHTFVGSAKNYPGWELPVYDPQTHVPLDRLFTPILKTPPGFEYLTVIKFSAAKPDEVITAAQLQELNRLRKQNGKKEFDSHLFERIHLYTLAMDIEVANRKVHVVPDITTYMKDKLQLPSTGSSLQDFALSAAMGLSAVFHAHIAPDPMDVRKLSMNGVNLQFSNDFTQVTTTGAMAAELLASEKLSPAAPTGYYRARLKLVDANQAVQALYSLKNYLNAHLLEKVLPLYIVEAQDHILNAKTCFYNKTVQLSGYQSPDGATKLFGLVPVEEQVIPLFLAFSQNRVVTSMLPTSISGQHYVTFLSTLEKTDLHGREAEMARNYEALGTIPETVIGVPQVWNNYDVIEQPNITEQMVSSDPTWSAAFGMPHKSPASDQTQLAEKQPVHLSPANPRPKSMFQSLYKPKEPVPPKPLTDEERMQEEYRKRRHY